MNCPRPSVSNGRTRIQTHSEPWLMLLTAVCAVFQQRATWNTECVARETGCASGLAWGRTGPCAGSPLFSGN